MVARMKFVVGGIIIIAALFWLGLVGFEESKAYYITVDEYRSMQESLAGKTIRLAGDVVPGSIDRSKTRMEFVIGSGKSRIKVRYVGSDIIPDTFNDESQALVEGSIADNGVFHARRIEAKCASKYEAEYKSRTSP
ncbi:MAG: cytochrome c maturation protein CcmE [Acidobacteria bacterium]|nr:cytochrome c maturation protein CcmE [Acidobacteriota bacterium]